MSQVCGRFFLYAPAAQFPAGALAGRLAAAGCRPRGHAEPPAGGAATADRPGRLAPPDGVRRRSSGQSDEVTLHCDDDNDNVSVRPRLSRRLLSLYFAQVFIVGTFMFFITFFFRKGMLRES